MRSAWTIALILGLGPLVTGCPKKPSTVPVAGTNSRVMPDGARASAANDSNAGQARALDRGTAGDDEQHAMSTIYFDFDSSEIRAEFAGTVAAHGRKLARDKGLHVRLEGNTDERGSAEYNVGLGERRAQAVKRALLLQGALESQLTTVSYGRERPAIEGHDEAAWARNRRVEIVTEP